MTKRKTRLTIGLLIDHSDNKYSLLVLRGVQSYCKKNDINLLILEGSDFTDPINPTQHHGIYNLANKDNIDGAIILSNNIARGCDTNRIINFVQQINTRIPCISIGYKIENIPSILPDNSIGFTLLLEHLITSHSLKRLCFIKGIEGNPDAEERFNIYKQVLNKFDIPFCDDLVIKGKFLPLDGINAVKVLIDERKLSFDAIVAANDYMAIGAIQELTRRGYNIPEDIAVTGFDNIDETIDLSPPLTTVAQPIFKTGYLAAEIMQNILSSNNIKVEETIVLPTHPILRDSCGLSCSRNIVKYAKPGNNEKNNISITDKNCINNYKKDFLKDCRNYLSEEIPESIFENLYEIFLAQLLSEKSNKSVTPLLKSIKELCLKYDIHTPFYYLINSIRKSLLNVVHDPSMQLKAEALLQTGLIHFGQNIIQKNKYQNNVLISLQRELNLLQMQLFTNFTISHQISTIASRISKLGIKRFTILYSQNVGDLGIRGTSLLQYKENNYTKTNELIFEDGNINGFLPSDRRYTAVVELLYNYGIIIMNNVPSGNERIYRALRDILSVAFNSSMFFSKIENQKDVLNKNITLLRQTMEGFIETMANILETRDPYTAGHQRRVSDLARTIATEMGCTEDQTNTVRMAAIIHDIGKICIPAEILNKPGRLRDEEFTLIKLHPGVAYDILKNIDFPWPLAKVVHQHHEKIDGSGYPKGLKGDEILLEAKILCVADVVEAMASHRPYRPALGIQMALDEIEKFKGKYFDTKVVNACLSVFKNGYSLKSYS